MGVVARRRAVPPGLTTRRRYVLFTVGGLVCQSRDPLFDAATHAQVIAAILESTPTCPLDEAVADALYS